MDWIKLRLDYIVISNRIESPVGFENGIITSQTMIVMDIFGWLLE